MNSKIIEIQKRIEERSKTLRSDYLNKINLASEHSQSPFLQPKELLLDGDLLVIVGTTWGILSDSASPPTKISSDRPHISVAVMQVRSKRWPIKKLHLQNFR